MVIVGLNVGTIIGIGSDTGSGSGTITWGVGVGAGVGVGLGFGMTDYARGITGCRILAMDLIALVVVYP